MTIEKIFWNGLDAVFLETRVYEAVLIPSVGANLVKLYNKEKQVYILRTPEAEEVSTFINRPQVFGLPLLFPPNRIENGTYSFEGKKYIFPITIPAQNNYHHGILKSQPFTVTHTEITADYVEVTASFFSHRINNDIFADFPHEFECNMTFRLSNEGLTHTISFKNQSNETMPLGLGYHTPIRVPFAKGSEKKDYKLLLSAGKRWELSERGLPTGKLMDLSTEELLLRQGGLQPTGKSIEWALTNEPISVDGKEYNGAVLIDERRKLRVFYEVDNQYKHWTFWNNGGEVDWVCPEPQTWAINAPNLDLPADVTGFQSLAAGKTWSAVSKLYVKDIY